MLEVLEEEAVDYLISKNVPRSIACKIVHLVVGRFVYLRRVARPVRWYEMNESEDNILKWLDEDMFGLFFVWPNLWLNNWRGHALIDRVHCIDLSSMINLYNTLFIQQLIYLIIKLTVCTYMFIKEQHLANDTHNY